MSLSRCLLLVLILALSQGATAARALEGGEGLWHSRDAAGGVRVRLYVFTSETCPHCARAEPFVRDLAQRYAWLDVDSR